MWFNACDLALTTPCVSLATVQLMDCALLWNSKQPFQLLSSNKFPRPPNFPCLKERCLTSEGQSWDPGFLSCSRKSHSPEFLCFQFCLKLGFQFRGFYDITSAITSAGSLTSFPDKFQSRDGFIQAHTTCIPAQCLCLKEPTSLMCHSRTVLALCSPCSSCPKHPGMCCIANLAVPQCAVDGILWQILHLL